MSDECFFSDSICGNIIPPVSVARWPCGNGLALPWRARCTSGRTNVESTTLPSARLPDGLGLCELVICLVALSCRDRDLANKGSCSSDTARNMAGTFICNNSVLTNSSFCCYSSIVRISARGATLNVPLRKTLEAHRSRRAGSKRTGRAQDDSKA